MKGEMNDHRSRLASWIFSLGAAVALSGSAVSDCAAQTGPSRLVVFADVVKLAQAHQSDDVILAYVRNAGAAFNLTADEIIYLSNAGVSSPVIAALQAKGPATPPPINPAPAPAPITPIAPTPVSAPGAPPPGVGLPPAASEAPEVTFDYFHRRLQADGTWLELPGYGNVWRPNAAVFNPDWRPYYDRGHWVYTENGWFWESEDPWGEIAFHYGRWHRSPALGWVWVPGYDWAPSWVSWRHSEGYLGWAPLPPEARFEAGVGLSFNGRVGVELDFGLSDAHYNFIGYDHFWERDYHRYYVPRERVVILYRGSHLANTYRIENHRFINEGYGRERIALVTHHDVIVVRPVIRDPIIVRHVEKTVVVVNVGNNHRPAEHNAPAGHGPEAAKPAPTVGAPAAHVATPTPAPHGVTAGAADGTPKVTPAAATPTTPTPVTSPNRPSTYSSGGGSGTGGSSPGSTPMRPSVPTGGGGGRTNRPPVKH